MARTKQLSMRTSKAYAFPLSVSCEYSSPRDCAPHPRMSILFIFSVEQADSAEADPSRRTEATGRRRDKQVTRGCDEYEP